MALYIFIMFISWSAVLYEGFGLPVINQSAGNVQHRQRTKRCACVNQVDSECHYFCHLDIIWVNTPSKTTVYGLGSPLSRRRRSTHRCFCANPADQTCNIFCVNSSKKTGVLLRSFSEPVQKKSELTSDLHIALENPTRADSGIEVTERSMDNAPVSLLRNLFRGKSMAIKKDASARQKSSSVQKPVPR